MPKTQEQQLLREPEIDPTDDVIAGALGVSYGAYTAFIEGLKTHNIHVDWSYYNDEKAWLGKALYKWTTTRGTNKEMTTLWLSIWNGFFRASIYIPEKARAGALALSLSDEMKEIIENSKQMGKLKFFPLLFDLRSDKLFDDIYALADFRKTIKYITA